MLVQVIVVLCVFCVLFISFLLLLCVLLLLYVPHPYDVICYTVVCTQHDNNTADLGQSPNLKWCRGLGKLYFVHLDILIGKFIYIHSGFAAINVHQHKTWLDLRVAMLYKGPRCRAWVYQKTVFILECLEFVGGTRDQDVYVETPLEDCQGFNVTGGDHLMPMAEPHAKVADVEHLVVWIFASIGVKLPTGDMQAGAHCLEVVVHLGDAQVARAQYVVDFAWH